MTKRRKNPKGLDDLIIYGALAAAVYGGYVYLKNRQAAAKDVGLGPAPVIVGGSSTSRNAQGTAGDYGLTTFMKPVRADIHPFQHNVSYQEFMDHLRHCNLYTAEVVKEILGGL